MFRSRTNYHISSFKRLNLLKKNDSFLQKNMILRLETNMSKDKIANSIALLVL